MNELEKYLVVHNFNKRLQYLKRKLKNKTVLIYGTGKLFQLILEKYDLSDLNIIGITDRKYLPEDEGKEEFGYKIIPFNKFNLVKADCILFAVQRYLPLLRTYRNTVTAKEILPLVKCNLKDEIIYNLKKIPLLYYFLKPRNNTFVLIKTNGKRVYNPRIKRLKVKFWGENSLLEIHEPFNIIEDVYISCGDNDKVIINAFNNHKRTRVLMGNNNQLIIGKNTTTENLTIHQINSNNTKVEIGEDCMIAYRVSIKTSDMHTIYDPQTRKSLNSAKNVKLGNHVWIAADTTILKGVSIPNNCMVGACSLVNKEFTEEHCIIAGSPAKVIKKGINWDRRGADIYPQN